MRSKNTWTYVTSISLVLLIIAELYSNSIIGNSYSYTNELKKSVAGFVTMFAIFTFIVSVVTTFKTKRSNRVFAILSSLLSLIIFGLAFFAYSFIGYGSY